MVLKIKWSPNTEHFKEYVSGRASCPFKLNLLNISTLLDVYCEKREGMQLAPKPPSLITAKLIQLHGLCLRHLSHQHSPEVTLFSFYLTPFSLCVLPVGTLTFFPSVHLSYVSGVIRCLIIDNSSLCVCGGGDHLFHSLPVVCLTCCLLLELDHLNGAFLKGDICTHK